MATRKMTFPLHKDYDPIVAKNMESIMLKNAIESAEYYFDSCKRRSSTR